MFQKDPPEANIQQVLISRSNNDIKSGVQTKRERRDYSLLQFCNSYCKPSTAAEQEATCKESTTIAVEKEADLCKKTTAMAVEKTIKKETGLCKNTTAIAVEREAGLCNKSLADAVEEARWCKKNAAKVEFLLAGPFKARKNNKIGEIKKYYHNYEFSMDLRFAESALQNPSLSQILVGIV